MKLVVLAGAKKGAAVPIKKDVFVIGRSRECSLRAGSEAISRKHCELKVTDEGLVARDLGSRNGTYVNDTKIDGPTTLSNGDELRIGPLEFRYEAGGELKKAKQPKVESVGEAVSRSAGKSASTGGGIEDSISDWLTDGPDTGESPSIGETLTMRTDETRIAQELAEKALAEDAAEDAAEETDSETAETAEQPPEEEDNGKKKKKKEPGKLPFRPEEPKSKDSREAAMQVLRDMARRR